jgi:hypothetical protein
VLALVAVCVTYFNTAPTLISGILGLAAFAVIVAGLIAGWTSGSRSQYAPSWRASSTPVRDNVVRMHPRRRNPFSEAVTQVRILWLKLRYWRMRNR